MHRKDKKNPYSIQVEVEVKPPIKFGHLSHKSPLYMQNNKLLIEKNGGFG